MITQEQLEDWLHDNHIFFNVSGYSIYIINSMYVFRMNQHLAVSMYTENLTLEGETYPTNPEKEKLIQTQCLLWGIPFQKKSFEGMRIDAEY